MVARRQHAGVGRERRRHVAGPSPIARRGSPSCRRARRAALAAAASSARRPPICRCARARRRAPQPAARRTRRRARCQVLDLVRDPIASTCRAARGARPDRGPDRGGPGAGRPARQPAVGAHRHPRPAGRDAGLRVAARPGPERAARAGAPHRASRVSGPAPAPARPRARPLSSPAREDLLRHPAHGQQAPRQLHRRDRPVRRRPGARRSGDLLHRRPARDHRRLRPGRAPRARLRHDGDPDRRGPRPRALHPVPPERRPRAQRAVVAAVGRDAARRAQPHAPVPRQVGRAARAGRGRAALLPRADGRRRARLPRRTRSPSARTSASTSS